MIRTTQKGLYHVKGSKMHTLYNEKNEEVSAGCDGQIELYYLANNIEDVIQRIEKEYTYKDGSVMRAINVFYIKEESVSQID
jgi:hypothetical protein